MTYSPTKKMIAKRVREAMTEDQVSKNAVAEHLRKPRAQRSCYAPLNNVLEGRNYEINTLLSLLDMLGLDLRIVRKPLPREEL